MSFDPSKPVNNAPVVAAELRGQFNGLKGLIDAVSGVTDAVVDGVNTVDPGQPAAVSVSVSGTTLHLSFDIPRGNDGDPGADGAPGSQGPQGPPFANAVVDAVTTLDPAAGATVDVGFDGTNVHFSFGVPRGVPGADGANGEVSNADLSSAIDVAIAGTSNNSDAVADLAGLAISNPPTHAEVLAIRDKLNELIAALRR